MCLAIKQRMTRIRETHIKIVHYYVLYILTSTTVENSKEFSAN